MNIMQLHQAMYCIMEALYHVSNSTMVSVADLEIFRGGFSFTKTPAKLEVKTKKKKKKRSSPAFWIFFSSNSKFTL